MSGVQQPDKPLSGSQTPLSGSQHRRGRASGSSTHGRVCGDQQTLRGRAEDHRPERGAVKITGLQGWHSRSERQNRCNTDQRPEVGAIRIMSAGTGAIRITSAEIGAIDIMKPSRAQSRALDRVAHARPGSLMRLSLGGGAGLAIGAARALGAAEDGSRDGSAVFGVDRARSALRVCLEERSDESVRSGPSLLGAAPPRAVSRDSVGAG